MGAIERDTLDQVKADTEKIIEDVENIPTMIGELNKYNMRFKPVIMKDELTFKEMNISQDPVENCFELTGKGTIYGLFFYVTHYKPVTLKIDDVTIKFEHYLPNGSTGTTEHKCCFVSLDKANIDSVNFSIRYFMERQTSKDQCNVYMTPDFNMEINKTKIISLDNFKSMGTIKSDHYGNDSYVYFAIDPSLKFEKYFSISHAGSDRSSGLSRGIGVLYKLEE